MTLADIIQAVANSQKASLRVPADIYRAIVTIDGVEVESVNVSECGRVMDIQLSTQEGN